MAAALGLGVKEILARAVEDAGGSAIALTPGLLLRIVGVLPDGPGTEDVSLI